MLRLLLPPDSRLRGTSPGQRLSPGPGVGDTTTCPPRRPPFLRPCHLPISSAPATLSSLHPGRAKHTPASGVLHWLVPLPTELRHCQISLQLASSFPPASLKSPHLLTLSTFPPEAFLAICCIMNSPACWWGVNGFKSSSNIRVSDLGADRRARPILVHGLRSGWGWSHFRNRDPRHRCPGQVVSPFGPHRSPPQLACPGRPWHSA